MPVKLLYYNTSPYKMKEADSSKIESSSFSFINFNWGDAVNKEPEDLVYPTILDPNLKDFYVEINQSLETYLKKVQPTFTYRIIDDFSINFVLFGTGEKILTVLVVDFEMTEFLAVDKKQLVVVLNRDTCKKKNASKRNKDYKQTIIKGHKFTPLENRYEILMLKLHNLQIKDLINVFFIDTADDLIKFVKNIIKSYKSKSEFVPKTKCYSSENKQSHFEDALLKIPGIGKCAAKSIVKKYKTLFNLYCKLSNDCVDELEKMIVWDEINSKGRPLGKYQADKLKKAFLSLDQNVLLVD